MTTPNYYPFGSKIELSVTITNQQSGAPDDPTDVQVAVTQSDGAVVIFTYLGGQVVKDSTGKYHYDYLPPGAGRYSYAWIGTGAVEVGSVNVPFLVTPSGFSP